MICFDSELLPQNFVWQLNNDQKASIYTMNAWNKLSELWHTRVNRKARPVVEGEHDKSWNDHVLTYVVELKKCISWVLFRIYQLISKAHLSWCEIGS